MDDDLIMFIVTSKVASDASNVIRCSSPCQRCVPEAECIFSTIAWFPIHVVAWVELGIAHRMFNIMHTLIPTHLWGSGKLDKAHLLYAGVASHAPMSSAHLVGAAVCFVQTSPALQQLLTCARQLPRVPPGTLSHAAEGPTFPSTPTGRLRAPQCPTSPAPLYKS